ncbi:hypothetical protein [Stieleria mannarensis]|uniref:hypothetical protein n=1 Tax=Stieleria mannarensis TaxID=2755585 RepID=UPI0016007A36|nr:hypothetical protein [Rhodopirellula sp. JC639]
MSATRKTSRDRAMIALTLTPPIALILFCVSAAATWQAGSATIRPLLEQSFSSELIDSPSPEAADYAARTSKEQTKSYRELIAAVDSLNYQYQFLFDALAEQEDLFDNLDQEHPVDAYIAEYLADAAPLLEMVRQFKFRASAIWQPNELGNPYRFSNGMLQSRGLTDLLMVEFRSAVRDKQTDRAIEAFDLFERLDPGINASASQRILPLVTRSIASGIWGEAELNQLDRRVHGSRDLEDIWQNRLRGTKLSQLPWLLRGEVSESWRYDAIPKTYAPSRRIQWLRHQDEFSRVRGIGTLAAIKQVIELENEWASQSESALDLALQIPAYNQHHHPGGSTQYFAILFAGIANERRYARTAIAVARYKLKYGDDPATLDDLSKVGLPRSETLDPTGHPFLFESDEQGCRLGNAAIEFTDGRGYSGLFDSRDSTLSSIVKQFVMLEFR